MVSSYDRYFGCRISMLVGDNYPNRISNVLLALSASGVC